jgi:hypothetical protein
MSCRAFTHGASAKSGVPLPPARRRDFAGALLETSRIACVLTCHVWSNWKCLTAGKVSASTVDLAAAKLALQVTKRRLPYAVVLSSGKAAPRPKPCHGCRSLGRLIRYCHSTRPLCGSVMCMWFRAAATCSLRPASAGVVGPMRLQIRARSSPRCARRCPRDA